MAQETIFSSSISSLLPDAFSHALLQIIDKVQPSIVQVRNGGRGAGTGIIWSTDGYVITNNHVVSSDKTTIQVHLADDRVLEAKVVDRHPKQDLAMLHIAADNLQAASVGDSSQLRVGEWVFAIGNPWGQRGVVTAGIVSGVGAPLAGALNNGDDSPRRYIKSDVHLAPGNSGGPLLDAEGKVVGINAMIFGGDLAVAIPSNVVSSWLEGLPKRRIELAIEVQPIELPADLRQKTGVEAELALLVVALGSKESEGLNGHSSDATVLIGDVLLNVAGKTVTDVASLLDILARREPQDTVQIRVVRGGTVQTLDVMIKTLEQAA